MSIILIEKPNRSFMYTKVEQYRCKRLLIQILVSLVGTVSCTEFFKAPSQEIEFDTREQLIINSVIKPDCLISAYIDISANLDSIPGNEVVNVERIAQSKIAILKNGQHFDSLRYVDDYLSYPFYFFKRGIWDKPFFIGSHPVEYNSSDVYEIHVSLDGLTNASAHSVFPSISYPTDVRFLPNQRYLEEIFHWEHEIRATIQKSDSEHYFAISLLIYTYENFELGVGYNLNIPEQKAFIENESEYIFNQYSEIFPYKNLAFKSSMLPDGSENFRLWFGGFQHPTPINSNNRNPDLFILYEISKEYYEYLHSSNLQRSLLPLPFTEPVPLLSNVEGGTGFFGSAVPVITFPLSSFGQSYLDGTLTF